MTPTPTTEPHPDIQSQKMEGVMSEIPDTWQPIDTAPKDGSEFLAYNGAMGVYSTSYTKHWKKRDGTWDHEYRGFPCGHSMGMFGPWDCQPSHWMPLPATSHHSQGARRMSETVKTEDTDTARASYRNMQGWSFIFILIGFTVMFNDAIAGAIVLLCGTICGCTAFCFRAFCRAKGLS